jgi:aarF domain-containing kinase
LRIVWAAANGDTKTLLDQSREMGFLTGEESDIMLKAHMESGLIVGEPFQTIESFDFKSSSISARLGQHTALFLRHRLT